MIFRPVMCCKVLAGEKHVTRRPAPEGNTCRYSTGMAYSIQPGRGRSSVARLRVTHVRRQSLGWLSDEAAFDEGFFSPKAFADYWRELYPVYDEAAKVFVIRFTLTTTPNTCPRCEAPVEWVLSPDEKSVMALDAERSPEGTILVSMRRVRMAGTAVPQTPEEIATLRQQAATREDEDVRLFTEHRCKPD